MSYQRAEVNRLQRNSTFTLKNLKIARLNLQIEEMQKLLDDYEQKLGDAYDRISDLQHVLKHGVTA